MGDKELTQERLFVCYGLSLCRFNWLGNGEELGPFIRARRVCRNHREHLQEEGMETAPRFWLQRPGSLLSLSCHGPCTDSARREGL